MSQFPTSYEISDQTDKMPRNESKNKMITVNKEEEKIFPEHTVEHLGQNIYPKNKIHNIYFYNDEFM